MALTVRYPNGQAITYNDGWYYVVDGPHTRIYNRNPTDGGTLVALVMNSSGAVIEWYAPCKIENPLGDLTVRRAAEYLCKFAEGHNNYETNGILADLKRTLSRLDGRGRTWRKSK